MYFARLVGESKNDAGELVEGDHIRCKGVPTPAVRIAAEARGQTVLELFKDLMAGKPVTFNLNCGGERPGFVYGRDLAVRSYKPEGVTRTLCFDGAG